MLVLTAAALFCWTAAAPTSGSEAPLTAPLKAGWLLLHLLRLSDCVSAAVVACSWFWPVSLQHAGLLLLFTADLLLLLILNCLSDMLPMATRCPMPSPEVKPLELFWHICPVMPFLEQPLSAALACIRPSGLPFSEHSVAEAAGLSWSCKPSALEPERWTATFSALVKGKC
jgi:hypothetical protein